MLIDTHSHIYLEQFDEDRDAVVANAIDSGVGRILLPNIDSSTITRLHKTEQAYDSCIAMMGLHPTSVNKEYKKELNTIEKHLFSREYIGVGEIGIDLYWDQTHKKEQLIAFEQQIVWAKKLNLPIVIHCRDAFNEVFSVVDKLHDSQLKGIFHSFGGDFDQAKHIADYGTFKLGINGVVTFKNSNLYHVLAQFNPSLIVVETDAPYLAPVPHRGRRNQSSYVRLVLEKIAIIYGMDFSAVEELVWKNTLEIFDI